MPVAKHPRSKEPALLFRHPQPDEFPQLEDMVVDSFEPITWFKNVDAQFGPPAGIDWRSRWRLRMKRALARQEMLIGEAKGEIVAFASGHYDPETRVGFIDLLAVDRHQQRRGYGREMLRGMLAYFKRRGAVHANLECLSDNEAGNSLYRAEGFSEVARSIRWYIRLD